MRTSRPARRRVIPLVLVVALLAGTLAVASASPGAAQVPGFDGTTIKVGGLGLQSLPAVPTGARARFQEFNDNNELKGVKIEFVDYANDGGDPATALSESRRLVTQEQVFAIVPEVSVVTAGEYLKSAKVPVFGSGFTGAYCSPKPTTSLWLFGPEGCRVTDQPTITGDTEANILKYMQSQGIQHPTVAVIDNDDQVGKIAAKLFAVQYEGNPGWGKLVYNEATWPAPPAVVGDSSPYVQALMTSNGGKQPDLIRCSVGAAAECLSLYLSLGAAGYKGEFEHNLYTDALVKPLNGSLVAISHHNLNETGNATIDKMKASVEKVKPGTAIDSGIVYGYESADQFVAALKKAANGKKSNITRESVQKAASTMTWQMKDFAGPTKYPASTVAPTPLCREIVKSDGAAWQTVEPYTCYSKNYKVK